MPLLKPYNGRIPACGVFCGGCPTFTRDRKPCPGAKINGERCERCKTFHLCCKERGITHCHECEIFPCKKFKNFSKRWLKYGQNFVENQNILKRVGKVEFLSLYNKRAKEGSDGE
jgi:putative acetyltransferase